MGTLEELQKLPDGDFHQLGDDLIRRLEPRYRRLRTHGINDRGESIKGQPDSYVGDTAATCTIAVCYTVERKNWWTKVVDDVREAVANSPNVGEILVVIPRNVDRDGPKKGKVVDWLANAKRIAGKASVELIDGPKISRLLDKDHQDIRFEHLSIPYSRLCGPSILAGCQATSSLTLDSIKSSGRYDPDRYASRMADRDLFRLWQSALRKEGVESDRRVSPVRLIALVSDSGVGKTSLVCEFSRSLGKVLPTLLIQARDLMFATEESLVAAVIHKIQGVLEPAARVIEEAALVKHLAGTVPLTVVLDGLDETHEPEAVKKAITFWLNSKIGQTSILVTTSRLEFWRTCSDQSWVRWMPNPMSHDRSPIKVTERSDEDHDDPFFGVRLPDRFNEEELEMSWLRAGHTRQEFLSLSTEAKEELRHPFTLRVFLDLLIEEGTAPRTVTRVALLESWLNRRLTAEEMSRERITACHYQQALRVVASRIGEASGGSVTVDNLDGVPRFDRTHPPGPVVHRLIEANILETLPGRSDHIRFSVEAVQDFYWAEADVEEIKINSVLVAENFSRTRFTAVYARLVRIGHRLICEDVRDDFVHQLSERDFKMAAIILRAAPDRFSSEIRKRICGQLGNQISARHRVQAAMAITLLGELHCDEAVEALASCLLISADHHPALKRLVAEALTKHGYVPASSFVYRWGWFGIWSDGGVYFFKELLAQIRGATCDFRSALAADAFQELSNVTGTKEHRKAVVVLAYLGDNGLINHLADRLEQNGLLATYENQALIAHGSDAAGSLFVKAVLATGSRLTLLPDNDASNDARNALHELVIFESGDVRYLITPAFVRHLERLVEDSNPEVSLIACELVRRGQVASLFYAAAVTAPLLHKWSTFGQAVDCSYLSANVWREWWSSSNDTAVRRKLLLMLPHFPNAEIESILLDCLDVPDFSILAAVELGKYGSVRSAIRLREILADDAIETDHRKRSAAAHALGDLRDDGAVSLLELMASEETDDWAVREATNSLGLIGTPDAEAALWRLLQNRADEQSKNRVVEAILCCGSHSAVVSVVGLAERQQDGLKWLVDRMAGLGRIRGWRRGEFFTHIHTEPLTEFLDSQFESGSPDQNWTTAWAFRSIDSPSIREILRKWAGQWGSSQDPLVRESDQFRMSELCCEDLQSRGDEAAIEYTLDGRRAINQDEIYISVAIDGLRHFPAEAVARQIRSRLAMNISKSDTLRMLSLLGRFGEPADAELLSRFVDDADDSLANTAFVALLRISDPLLVPEGW